MPIVNPCDVNTLGQRTGPCGKFAKRSNRAKCPYCPRCNAFANPKNRAMNNRDQTVKSNRADPCAQNRSRLFG